jgi:hypothetical protein
MRFVLSVCRSILKKLSRRSSIDYDAAAIYVVQPVFLH